jgi:hypothetical protein
MALIDYLRLARLGWAVRRLFDPSFYLERYPDVRQSGVNPLFHYLQYGVAEGRKPNHLFEPDYYLSCCPQARNSANPLLHFIKTRGRLGNPHPLFDCNAYLAAHPAAAKRGINPLLDYITQKDSAAVAFGSRSPVLLEILDVPVRIAFWEDASGRMNFLAEPQQQPFFHAMRFDQLAVQIRR